MGKRKLFTGIFVGAFLGGVAAMFDKETRDYTKEKVSEVKATTSYYVKNPSEAVSNMKSFVSELNNTVQEESTNAINLLDQVESTFSKVMKK